MQNSYYNININEINKETRKDMIENLINLNMYYECKELCYVFINYSKNEVEKEILHNVIRICSCDRDKTQLISIINEI